MPTTNRKANKLIAKGRALRRFDRGLFYIQLVDREDGYTQPIAVGVDPGSKKEALTVKSGAHTYLNIQVDAVAWVGDALKVRMEMRRGRRYRKTPYRRCRPNRNINKVFLPPSTRARWEWKLRLCRWLARYYPVMAFVVEDVRAVTKPGKRRWNGSFSPLEVGKQWFYAEVGQLAPVYTLQGHETKAERDALGLKKPKSKLSEGWDAHCVDSWVLANRCAGGHISPDNRAVLYIVPLRFHRRQLHRFQPEKGGIRKAYGGTLSMGFKRGSWVKHSRYGVCYVGGTLSGRISLHSLQDGKRLCQNAKPEDCQQPTLASWRIREEEAYSSAA
jgi:hypothetical protein